MAIRVILQDGDPTLRKRSKLVQKVNAKTLQLLDDLAETLRDADGIGLAAPQVGVLKRVAVIDVGDGDSGQDAADPCGERDGQEAAAAGAALSEGGRDASAPVKLRGIVELINPEIVEQSGEQTFYEGCLSNPGKFGDARRPARVVLRALDRSGRSVMFRADGLYAVACCHEIDHLDGVMFTDRVQGSIYTSEEVKALREAQKGERQGGGASGSVSVGGSSGGGSAGGGSGGSSDGSSSGGGSGGAADEECGSIELIEVSP